MPHLSSADFDDLAAHFTSGCDGCPRCDLYPGIVEGDPDALSAYLRYMAEADGDEAERSVGPSAPPEARRCLRCGSERIVRDAKLEDRSDSGHVALQVLLGEANPSALLFTSPLRVELRADLCGECGHVEIRVADPAAMWAAFGKLPPQRRP